MTLFNIVDTALFVIFLINIMYLLVFSLAYKFGKREKSSIESDGHKRIVILIPAYKEDSVILECVNSCLEQDYPSDRYDVVVISDRMSDQTNRALADLPVTTIPVHFENSTKSKALNYAMDELCEYDIAVILDADNTISADFLLRINSRFSDSRVQVIQAHRCAKNQNTHVAVLDALSEEMNNSIFREGHTNLGLSSALIGSGMAFDYDLFKKTMATINAIGGFDRALELTLLKGGKQILYLHDVYVLDEKVQYHHDFSQQRRRWLSAQIHYLCSNLKEIPSAIANKNWDFCDKMFQQMSLPRVLLLGFCTIFAICLSFVDFSMSLKWWVILTVLIITLFMAIPKHLIGKQLVLAALHIPYTFVLMAINMFYVKSANKKFIHTKHGVKH